MNYEQIERRKWINIGDIIILTCNRLYGHKRTLFAFGDRRSHHVLDPEYIDTQDRYISHSFQNPEKGETERRQKCLKECLINLNLRALIFLPAEEFCELTKIITFSSF